MSTCTAPLRLKGTSTHATARGIDVWLCRHLCPDNRSKTTPTHYPLLHHRITAKSRPPVGAMAGPPRTIITAPLINSLH